MDRTHRINSWLKGVIAIAVLGFILNFPSMGGVRLVRAQAAEAQTSTAGFSWEYQLDFNATSLLSANQQASSLTPSLNSLGVASELLSLGDSIYRLSMTGDQGMQQIRQTLFSPLLAGFIGGAVELEVDMPVVSLLDTTFTLESNPTTGYRWEVIPSKSVDFVQAGVPTFTTQLSGYGVPSVQTLVLHPGNMGDGIVHLVYRRTFEPNETITRHLRITLGAQAMEIDLSNPHPQVISSQAGSIASPNTMNPIDEIPLKATLPASFDWRTYGIVPAPRDQGSCGGCWSFGTVGIMESVIAIVGGPLTDLSEQFLISCNTSGWSCNGGLTAHMYHYDTLGKNQTAIGAVLEADKPYSATNGSCSVPYNHPYILSGWQFIVPNEWTMPTVDQIKNAIITYGPVTAGVCVGNAFQAYESGIFSTDETSDCPGSTFRTNHQIILVGWNDAGGYWIMRNSWGSGWGESGYMKIAYNTSRVGEGTSWVTWGGAAPAPFGKSSPANASFGQPGNPVLSWQTSSGAASYEYCIDTSSNNTCNTSWISTGTSTSVPLSSLASGTHSWQVHAINAAGTTEANSGTWWSFTVGQARRIFLPLAIKTTPLPGSFNKTAPANSATNQSVNPTLSWVTSSNATSYEYCIDTSNNNACNATWTSTAASTSIGLGGLSLSTSYYWQVRANNSSGTTYANGSSTNYWSFTTASASTQWTTILSEDFEGGFPSAWELDDFTSSGYVWGKRNCRPFAGSYSGWGVGGGSSGSSLGCGSNYPNNVDTMMVYGPFSLADATAADLSFQLWLNSESGYDDACRFASIDNANWYGTCTTGNTSGWITRVLDLTSVFTLGNLMGQPNVWIALNFYSDGIFNYAEGANVDNIVLRKCTSGTCSGSPSVPISANGLMVEAPSQKTIPR